MQRLTGITEQLKTRECKSVIAVLTTATKLPPNVLIDRLRVLALLREWRQVDLSITEAQNEAKDNMKCLASLERYMEPLFSGDPEAIAGMMPAMLNTLKTVHSIARFFGTKERMTRLFAKITNQMVTACKLALNGKDPPDRIFDRDPVKLLKVLESSLRLNEIYQSYYVSAKDELLAYPKGKQFDFSESTIFGKFDSFCRRLVKLVDVFSTIRQFSALASAHLEGVESLLVAFDQALKQFRKQGHDVLDTSHNTRFDADMAELDARIEFLEAKLAGFVKGAFETCTAIEGSLALVKTFQGVLYRREQRGALDARLSEIVQRYNSELAAVQECYEQNKHAPPIARNMPPVAGNIMWCRLLLKRIEDPIKAFQDSPSLLALPEAKKAVKTFNRVARTLVAFEVLWHDAWMKAVEAAKAGLAATLVIKHPKTGSFFVNFDREILRLAREAHCLGHIPNVELPEAARAVMTRAPRFKRHLEDLTSTLDEYGRVMAQVPPALRRALEPHRATFEQHLRPGLTTLTWSSMNIDAFHKSVEGALASFAGVVAAVKDLVENRIDKGLKSLTRTVLVDLASSGRRLSLDEFVAAQEGAARLTTPALVAKNLEVEVAVGDLLALIERHPLSPQVGPVPLESLAGVRSHFKALAYRAVLSATRSSLDLIKRRVCSRAASSLLFAPPPLFEVDVQLSVPSVRLSPSLSEVQRAINKCAVAVIRASKSVSQWEQAGMPEEEKRSYFDVLGCDMEIIKVALLLTGALHGTKSAVRRHLQGFRKFDWLWKEDKEAAYARFAATDPSTADFEAELRRFVLVEHEVKSVTTVHSIGALSLNTTNLKLQLTSESRQWKIMYSKKIHMQAKAMMQNVLEYIEVTNFKL